MLKSKEEVANHVTKLCKRQLRELGYKKRLRNLSDRLEADHNISITESTDLLSLRTDAVDATEFVLFCIIQLLDEEHLSEYFTEVEINKFSSMKLKTKTIKFPLKYDVIQVTETQWIGSISVKELMVLYYDAQLIRYNENAQRTLKRMTSNNVEYYKIDINRNAVNEIIESYKGDSYIPNTITLNIPETAEFEYKNKELIIRDIDAFDILDGYHRLVAMCNLFMLDKKFDYPMEIRFVSFSEDKAKQFIWQEDQKTKMAKIDSDSFNQNNYGNQVIAMLDQVTALKGIVNRNGIIKAGMASRCINSIWYNNVKRKYSRKDVIETRDLIRDGIIHLMDIAPELFEKHWSNLKIVELFFLISIEEIENYISFNEYLNKQDFKIVLGDKREITRMKKEYENFIGR